jgi:hypothetical protein
MYKTKLDTDKISQLEKFFNSNIEELSPEIERIMNHYEMSKLYHYTSLSTLFSILESDSLWLSGLHFSNDSSEEKLLGDKWLYKNKYKSDNFIFCVGEKEDLLSQWRGYCKDGGVSIGFDIAQKRKYNVLFADFDISKKYIYVEGIALPVLYTQKRFSDTPEEGAQYIIRKIQNTLNKKRKETPSLRENDFVPYIKHYAFEEELERRLLFSNTNGELLRCIRFRPLPNGTKIPYVVIKYGCVNEHRRNYLKKSEMKIKNIIDNSDFKKTVVVPDCSNQVEICNLVREYIIHNELNINGNVRVFCEGHLPIRSIRIAPMPDQNRIEEQVTRFCRNKYWLKDVDISVSDIPYVPSINN